MGGMEWSWTYIRIGIYINITYWNLHRRNHLYLFNKHVKIYKECLFYSKKSHTRLKVTKMSIRQIIKMSLMEQVLHLSMQHEPANDS